MFQRCQTRYRATETVPDNPALIQPVSGGSTTTESVVAEMAGKEDPPGFTGIRLRNVQEGSESLMGCGGVSVAIGHTPASELVVGRLEVRNDGFIATEPGTTRTSELGDSSAGDLVDGVYRPAMT